MSMLGGLGDLAGMMKTVQNIQKNVKQMKEELAKLELKGVSTCGQAEVLMSGDMNMKQVTLSETLAASGDKAKIEQALFEAASSALTQVKAEAAKRLSEASGGLVPPGMSPF